MPAGACPSRHDLEAYVVGALNAIEKQAIGRHLTECSDCRTQHHQLESGDEPLLASLYDPRWPPGYAEEQECKRALARAEAMELDMPRSEAAPAAEAAGGKAKRKLSQLRQYQLLQRLGGGGMGDVYKARHAKLERIVAVKVLSKHLKKDPDAIARFHREMKVVGKLNHPNIVRATDADEDAGFHYMVMDLVEGYDLSSLVKRLGPLPVADACGLAEQAARALQCIHEHGLVHRDIKPSNMMLEPSGQLKLLDLGLSLLRDDDVARDRELTSAGVLMGTCDYISPEQCSDSHSVDIRADLYSLGCTLYELLCGHAPFGTAEFDTRMKKVMAHLQSPVPPLRDLRPEVPQPLASIVDRLLVKDRNERMSTPAELVAALQPYVAGCDLAGLVRAMEGGPRAKTVSGVGDTGADRREALAGTVGEAVREDMAQRKSLEASPPSSPTRAVDARRKRFQLSRQQILVASLVAAACFLLLFFGIVFLLRTRDGTLVVEISEPDAVVQVLDGQGKVEITRKGETGKLSIAVDPGKHRLKVEKEGFSLFAKEFTIASGGKELVTARLDPLPSAAESKPVSSKAAPSSALAEVPTPSSSPPPAIAPFTPEEAKRHQQAWAKHLGVPVAETNSIGMTMTLIPPGEFEMGSSEEQIAEALKSGAQQGWWGDGWMKAVRSEGPRHKVRIMKPFYLSAHEVTVIEFRTFVEAKGYRTEAETDGRGAFGPIKAADEWTWGLRPEATWRNPGFEQTDEHPVVAVSWDDARAFCQWLSEKENQAHRLPTEAEWEFSCRSGSTTLWCFGDDEAVLREYAWYGGAGYLSHPVGRLLPNGFGLFDMHGNAGEWCSDWYSEDYYSTSPVEDPGGPPGRWSRASRGGAFNLQARRVASAYRNPTGATNRLLTVGFRVARTFPSHASEAMRAKPAPQEADAKSSAKPESQIQAKSPPPPLAVAPFDTATARKHQEAWAAHLSVPLDMTNSIGMSMILVPPGEFMMGSPDTQIAELLRFAEQEGWLTEKSAKNIRSEGPQHKVRITRPFYLGAHEVTVGQFKAFVEATGHQTEAETDGKGAQGIIDGQWTWGVRPNATWRNPGFEQTDEHPVVAVSWNDAQVFCQWLREKEKQTYRLPSEAEWEFSCRSGSTTLWCFGDDSAMLDQYTSFGRRTTTSPVGQKLPNGFGLFDVYGNADEWCSDCYAEGYYGSSPVEDPQGPLVAERFPLRTTRGGAFNVPRTHRRSAYRSVTGATSRGCNVGFRVVRTIQ